MRLSYFTFLRWIIAKTAMKICVYRSYNKMLIFLVHTANNVDAFHAVSSLVKDECRSRRCGQHIDIIRLFHCR